MIARYAGRCACGNRFPEGATINYDRDSKKTIGCPACVSTDGVAPVSPARSPEPAPRAPRAAAKPLPAPDAATARAAAQALLLRLDLEQRAVAAWLPADGNVRVVAAAGSGKTTTVVALVSQLLWGKILDATQIVATTFTAKAGAELRERLAHVLPPGSLREGNDSPLRVGTFHSLALRSLRARDASKWDLRRCLDASGRAAGVPSTFVLWAKVLDYAGPEGLPGTGAEGLGLDQADPRAYALAVGVARSASTDARDISGALDVASRENNLPYLAQAWGLFEASKRAIDAFDFADVIAAYADGLDAGEIRDSAKLVTVDEAQDNDHLQYRIAERIAKNGGGSVIVVGDLRQSIYSWRGAAPALYKDAGERLGARTLEITTNYRSVEKVVALGNTVADGQDWNIGKPCRPHRTDAGAITVLGHDTPTDEANAVAAEIGQAASQGTRADAHAILVRTNAAAASFEAALITAGIPVSVVGGTSYFGRKDVLDALAYVALAAGDDYEALARVRNRPKRFVGAQTIAQVTAAAGVTLLDKLDATADRVRSRQASGLRDLHTDIAALRSTLAEKGLAATVNAISQLIAPPEQTGEADDDRGGLLAALVEIARQREGKGAVLFEGQTQPGADAKSLIDFAARCRGEVVTVSEGDEAPTGRVVISTVHKAKGLEWPVVFVSASAGVFPHSRSVKPDRLAEERRLFYVAVTRAKDVLHLSYSDVDVYGRDAGPSEFLDFVEGEPPADGGGVVEPPPPEPAITTEMPAITPPPAGVVAPTAPFSLTGERLAAARASAKALTDATPKPAAGQRYVSIDESDFAVLLAPLGFKPVNVNPFGGPSTQVVYETSDMTKVGQLALRVYTSIPVGGGAARGVGEDSIRVSLVWRENGGFGDMGPSERAVLQKLPYACRTHGWRLVLLDRIEEVVSKLGRACRRCGAPTIERRAGKFSNTNAATFHGCVRYPKCEKEG